VYTTLVIVCITIITIFICISSASHIYCYAQQHSEQLKSACYCFLAGWHLCLSYGDVDAPGGRSMEVFSSWWHSLCQYWLRNNVQKQTNRLLWGFLCTSTRVWVASICESNQAHPAADLVMRTAHSNQHNLLVYIETMNPLAKWAGAMSCRQYNFPLALNLWKILEFYLKHLVASQLNIPLLDIQKLYSFFFWLISVKEICHFTSGLTEILITKSTLFMKRL